MSEPRYIFVGGLHGSGTSLVHRCLRAHPAVSGFKATGVPEDEGQHLQALLPTARSLGGPGRFGRRSGAHLTEDSALATPATREALLSAWGSHWDDVSPLRVEKSPPNLLRFRLLQALFPGAACVAVMRHPLAVAASTRAKRLRGRLQSHETLVAHWIHCHRVFAEDRERIQDIHVLRYEELVSRPEEVLRALFAHLGLDPIPLPEPIDPGRDARHAARWKARHRPSFLGRKWVEHEAAAASWGYSIREFRAVLR
ncbi:MAG: sulfotransferase [Myxococcota bacterium]|nr:sulfotransferase [Myxococcota bacterium]